MKKGKVLSCGWYSFMNIHAVDMLWEIQYEQKVYKNLNAASIEKKVCRTNTLSFYAEKVKRKKKSVLYKRSRTIPAGDQSQSDAQTFLLLVLSTLLPLVFCFVPTVESPAPREHTLFSSNSPPATASLSLSLALFYSHCFLPSLSRSSAPFFRFLCFTLSLSPLLRFSSPSLFHARFSTSNTFSLFPSFLRFPSREHEPPFLRFILLCFVCC